MNLARISAKMARISHNSARILRKIARIPSNLCVFRNIVVQKASKKVRSMLQYCAGGCNNDKKMVRSNDDVIRTSCM